MFIYTGVIFEFTPKFLYIFLLIINLNAWIYIGNGILYSMENKEKNPTIVVANDDKKEETKKEDSTKTDK